MKKKFALLMALLSQINFGQTLPVGLFQIINDGVNNTTITSNGVAKMDMGYDGTTGYINFGAHTGNGQNHNILYMRGKDGNVGVGTSNPYYKFQIGELNNGEVSKLSIPGVYNFEELKMGQYGNGKTGLEMITHSNFTHSFGVRLFSGVDTGSAGLLIQTADPANSAENLNYTTKLALTLDGNVGIGTTAPDAKLTVAGDIHAREVKVTTAAGTVPDYVFANDYKLKSLDEVEAYIKQNSHLPEIPSAQEIEKNGLMLAEMNLNLLKKIEELTLYMIELKKENQKQNEKILSLENKLKN